MAITELETLKDINFYKELGKFTSNDKIKELLKSKAIKWAKFLKDEEMFDGAATIMKFHNIMEEELN